MIHVVHLPRPDQGRFLPSCILPLLLEGDNPVSTAHIVLNSEDSKAAVDWVNAFVQSNGIDIDSVALTRAAVKRSDIPGLVNFPFPLHQVQAYYLTDHQIQQTIVNLEQPF